MFIIIQLQEVFIQMLSHNDDEFMSPMIYMGFAGVCALFAAYALARYFKLCYRFLEESDKVNALMQKFSPTSVKKAYENPNEIMRVVGRVNFANQQFASATGVP